MIEFREFGRRPFLAEGSGVEEVGVEKRRREIPVAVFDPDSLEVEEINGGICL